MRASAACDHDPDAAALRGPSPDEAASSLAYWRGRLERLPRRRRGARREARAMVAAWEDRVRRAELERWGRGPIGRALATLAVVRGQRPGAVARRALDALVPRRLLRGVLALTVVAAVAFGVTLAVVIAHLL